MICSRLWKHLEAGTLLGVEPARVVCVVEVHRLAAASTSGHTGFQIPDGGLPGCTQNVHSIV